MSAHQHDCIVIGSGPGGYVAAIRAAQLGLRTAIVEREPAVGGRCLHEACIPAKAVLRSADLLDEVRRASAFGIEVGSVEVDFGAIAGRRREVIATLAGGVTALLARNGVEVVTGEATVAADGSITVGDRVLPRPGATILATGSTARDLPGIPYGGRVVGTREAWALDVAPTSLAVLGAGASGVEIASAYARLGTRVELVEAADRVLPTEDADISRIVQRRLTEQGVHVHGATTVRSVESGDRDARLATANRLLRAEWVVLAIGRRADRSCLAALDLRTTAEGLVEVDGRQETSVPGVFAIGDLVPGPALAHKASEEGVIAAEAAAGRPVHPLDRTMIPRATFCSPNVGSVGLTEEQARARGHDVVVGRVPYGAAGGAVVAGDTAGLVKVVADRAHGEILGAHVVGARATELVQQLLDVAVLEGGVPELARMIHSHPTFSELVGEVARAAAGWPIHG